MGHKDTRNDKTASDQLHFRLQPFSIPAPHLNILGQISLYFRLHMPAAMYFPQCTNEVSTFSRER